jgi:hypothetical protein
MAPIGFLINPMASGEEPKRITGEWGLGQFSHWQSQKKPLNTPHVPG